MALRKPLQGVSQIIRFNWHFYAFATVISGLLLWLWFLTSGTLSLLFLLLLSLVFLGISVSLLTSLYVYDLSGLYDLNWLKNKTLSKEGRAANIHAGFDEFAEILFQNYPDLDWSLCDFYDPATHTERSIKRARKAFPPSKGTIRVNTTHLPFEEAEMDLITLLFAAHEIRDQQEREKFFSELHRVSGENARIVLLEHLRDLPNFLAYSIGAFHFLPRSRWLRTWKNSGWNILAEERINPFVRCFTLEKNGDTP